jgi:secretion/DNA translocation related TadE-like protein
VTEQRAGDRGAATVWTVGAIAALMAVSVLVIWLGAAAATRHRAASAADLAALAAAGVAVEGERAACEKARWVTDRMSVELHSCRLDGADAVVEVVAQPSGVLAGFGAAEARARAGPVAAAVTQVERSSSDGKRQYLTV